ncbi:MAG: helicase-related protein, partial [Bacteroidota bacterium]
MQNFDFKPGSLVTLRDRPWIILPSEDKDLLLLKPLGGSEEEITGIFIPLAGADDRPQSYDFVKPSEADLGDIKSARLLYNASRLAFRNAAGPFRCLGKLSFRPRSYQMVPLIMALKHESIRLLIADDVGVGKTIEALLIAKELYERREIKRFAIVCLPHLCDQWQGELKDKFGIEAVVIRSGTASALERKIRTHENIFRAFPFQIISIDYIKSGTKRQVFLDHCPEMVLVDEAHTCAKPKGASKSQMLRYYLLHDIAKNPQQHLVMLTATPHSGKQEEFQSLMGLLKHDFESIDITNTDDQNRKTIAEHFVQRRRADVIQTIEETGDDQLTFPERNSIDKNYEVGEAYASIFDDILAYARESVLKNEGDKRKQRYSYWDALALLRGIMSSPEAGKTMLEKKAANKRITEEEDDDLAYVESSLENGENDQLIQDAERENVMDSDYSPDDNLPLSALAKGQRTGTSESRKLLAFAQRMDKLSGIQYDHKAREALIQVKDFMDRGYNPIVFCRYIQTANYLGNIFKANLKDKKYKDVQIEVVTSEKDDELRKSIIDEMTKNSSGKRLLIATDCLSEGINLQDGFNAVVHYDLPWNPNRLEQREGRVDRFGQRKKTVEVALLYGSNNPIDGVVLEVLLRKAREIRKSIGVSVPFPENSASVMEAVTNAILLKPSVSIKQVGTQLTMFEDEQITEQKNKITKAL